MTLYYSQVQFSFNIMTIMWANLHNATLAECVINVLYCIF